MGSGVVVAVIVSDLLVADALVFWHPIIVEVTTTRITMISEKIKCLLLIFVLLYNFMFIFPNIVKNSRASVDFLKTFTKLLPTPSVTVVGVK